MTHTGNLVGTQEMSLTSVFSRVFFHFYDLQKWGLGINPQDSFSTSFSSVAPMCSHTNALECWQSSNWSDWVSSPGQLFGYLVKMCSLISGGESNGVKWTKNERELETWRGRLEMKTDAEGYHMPKRCIRCSWLAFILMLYTGLGEITCLKFLLCARYFVILTRCDTQDT